MLVQEAKEMLQKMAVEDVRELVRKELLKKDAGTLADICVTLFEDEQLLEWAVPAVLSEEKTKKPVVYGKLNETAVKRAIPGGTVSDGLLKVSLLESINLSNDLFSKHGIRLVPEGMEGDSFLCGVYAPIVEDDQAVQGCSPTQQTGTQPCPQCKKTLLQDEEERKQREEEARRALEIAANPTVNMPDPAHTSNLEAPLPMAPKGRSR